MKKSTTRRLLMLALCLTLISCTLIGGTLAKYSTTVSGSGTITAASWAFKANGSDTTLGSITLTPTNGNGVMQPGSTGSFTIKLDNSGSGVAASYVVNVTGTGVPTGMTFKVDGTAATLGDNFATGTLEANASEKTLTVTWEWAYEGDDNAYAGKDIKLDIEVIGTQVAPHQLIP